MESCFPGLHLACLPVSCRVKRKVEEYEYDESMEPSFRKSLFKTFNKTLEEGFFPLVIVDAINHKVHAALSGRTNE